MSAARSVIVHVLMGSLGVLLVLPGCLSEEADPRVEKLSKSKEGLIVKLEVLSSTSVVTTDTPRATFTLTCISEHLLEAAINYKSKTEKWSPDEEAAARARVNERFAGTTAFVLCYQGRAPEVTLHSISQNMELVDERGHTSRPLQGRYTRGLEAANVNNAAGYVYFPEVSFEAVNSYNVRLAGATYSAYQGGSPREIPPICFQFDTSEVDIASLVKRGLTEEEILQAGSIKLSLSDSDIVNILSLLLSVVSLAS
jgi:hypothetical protein